jgi:hypothetical protein
VCAGGTGGEKCGVLAFLPMPTLTLTLTLTLSIMQRRKRCRSRAQRPVCMVGNIPYVSASSGVHEEYGGSKGGGDDNAIKQYPQLYSGVSKCMT